MWRVGAYDLRRVFLLLAGRDLHLARALDHVEVGQDVAFAVKDEPRSHALLRDSAIKEVVRDCRGSNVHYRRQRLSVDGDVLLFLGIEGRRTSRFRQLNMSRTG